MPVANPLQSNEAFPGPREDFSVVIFAKAPVPGRCKTRLARSLGHRRAALIYRAMLEQAVAVVTDRAPGRVILACAPDTRHPFFVRLARRYGVDRRRQARGDLGVRMAHGIGMGRRTADRVVLMGSDQPELDGAWLAEAFDALAGTSARAWLAPTDDGGYWAIGLNRIAPRVFRGPRWSTSRVTTATRTNLRRQGFTRSEIALRHDVDEPRDWQRLSTRSRTRLARRAAMPGVYNAAK